MSMWFIVQSNKSPCKSIIYEIVSAGVLSPCGRFSAVNYRLVKLLNRGF